MISKKLASAVAMRDRPGTAAAWLKTRVKARRCRSDRPGGSVAINLLVWLDRHCIPPESAGASQTLTTCESYFHHGKGTM
jgi:hypothetical protein